MVREHGINGALEKMKKERGGEVAEGYYTLPFFLDIAKKAGVDVPIATEIFKAFYEAKSPHQAAIDLMKLPLQSEIENK